MVVIKRFWRLGDVQNADEAFVVRVRPRPNDCRIVGAVPAGKQRLDMVLATPLERLFERGGRVDVEREAIAAETLKDAGAGGALAQDLIAPRKCKMKQI